MAEERISGRPVERTECYYNVRNIPGRPVERTGEPKRTSYTTYTVTGL
jgi:hypothetical protein